MSPSASLRRMRVELDRLVPRLDRRHDDATHPRLREQRLERLRVARAGRAEAEIEAADDGVGMEVADKRFFDKFRRRHRAAALEVGEVDLLGAQLFQRLHLLDRAGDVFRALLQRLGAFGKGPDRVRQPLLARNGAHRAQQAGMSDVHAVERADGQHRPPGQRQVPVSNDLQEKIVLPVFSAARCAGDWVQS